MTEHKGNKHETDWGPEEVKEILDTVSEKIPELLESLGDVLYSKDNAAKYADAIASFYKSLLDAGMSQEQAFELTEKYMSSLSPFQAMGGMFKGGVHVHDRD
jgi:hypothetical protein